MLSNLNWQLLMDGMELLLVAGIFLTVWNLQKRIKEATKKEP